MKSFSSTRWTSHGSAINVVYNKFGALIEALNKLMQSSDRVTSSTAKSIILSITNFDFIISIVLLRHIFEITTPLSNYLQSKTIDFIEALHLVDVAKKCLIGMRKDIEYENLITEAKEFALKYNLEETDFKQIRTRKKKKLVGENSNDEVSDSVAYRYKINTYFIILDQIIKSIETRFNDSRNIIKDLALLSPNRLKEMKNSNCTKLPDNCFSFISEWIKGIDSNLLKQEYITFAHSINELLTGLNQLNTLYIYNQK